MDSIGLASDRCVDISYRASRVGSRGVSERRNMQTFLLSYLLSQPAAAVRAHPGCGTIRERRDPSQHRVLKK